MRSLVQTSALFRTFFAPEQLTNARIVGSAIPTCDLTLAAGPLQTAGLPDPS
jgi:hypothetical protein